MSPFIAVIVLFILEFALSPEKKDRYRNADIVIVSGAYAIINAIAIVLTASIDPAQLELVGWIMLGIQAAVIIVCKVLANRRNSKCKKPIPDEYASGLRGKLTHTFYQSGDLGPGLLVKFFAEHLGLAAFIAAILVYLFFIIQQYYISTLPGGIEPSQAGTALLSFLVEFGIFLSGDSLFKELMKRYISRKNCRSARELAAARYENDDDYWRIFMDNYRHENKHIIYATKQNYVDEAPKSGISFYDFKTKKNYVYESSQVNMALEEFIKSNGLEVNPLYCAAFNLIEENKNVLIKTPSYVDFEPYLAAMINQKIAKTEKIVFIVNSIEDQQVVKKTMSRVFKDYFGFDSIPLFKTLHEWHKEVSARENVQEITFADPFRHTSRPEKTVAQAEPDITKSPDVIIASPDDICDPKYIDFIRAAIKRLGLIVYYNFNDCVQEEPLYAKVIHSLLDSEDKVSALYMTDGFFDFEQALDNFFSTRTIYQITVPRKAPQTSFDMIWKNENSQETQAREITDPSRNFGTHIGILFYALGFVKNDAMLVADENDAYSENMLNYTDDRVLNRIDHYVGWSNVMGGQNVMCTVSDTYNNIPHTYLSMRGIGTRSEYINIISRPYLLRNYLAQNLKFFSNEPRALSTFSSGIIRSERALAIQAVAQAYVVGYSAERLASIRKYFKFDEALDEAGVIKRLAELAYDGEIDVKVTFDEAETERYFIDEAAYTSIFFKCNFIHKIRFHVNGEVFERPYRDYQYIIPYQKIVLNGTKYTVLSIEGDDVELTNSNNRDPIYASRIVRSCKVSVKNAESYGKAYQHGTNSRIDFTHFVCDATVDVLGRVTFTDKYTLLKEDAAFTFNQIDNLPQRQYRNTNAFKIRIGSEFINESNRCELAHLMALLLNEMLPTFFPRHSDKIIISCTGWNTYGNLEESRISPRHIVAPLDINDPEEAKSNEFCIYIMEDSEVETGIVNVFWQDEEFRYMLKILEDYLYHLEFVDKEERRSMFDKRYDELLHTLRKTLLMVINDRTDMDGRADSPVCLNSIRTTRRKFYELDLGRKYNMYCDFCGAPIIADADSKVKYHYYHYSGRVSCAKCYSRAVSSDKFSVGDIKQIEMGICSWLEKKHKATIEGVFYDYLEDAAYVNNRRKNEFIITDDYDTGLTIGGYASPGEDYEIELFYRRNDDAIGCNSIDKENLDIYDIERTSYRLEEARQRHILICDGYDRDQYRGILAHELTHQWQFENLDMEKCCSYVPAGYDDFGYPISLDNFRIEGHSSWVEVNYFETQGNKELAKRVKESLLQRSDDYGFGYRWLCELMKVGNIDPYLPQEHATPEFRRALRELQMKNDVFGVMSLYFGKDAPPEEEPVDEAQEASSTDAEGTGDELIDKPTSTESEEETELAEI